MSECRRCLRSIESWRGETLCWECRKDVVLRDLPSDEVVRDALRHYGRPVEVLDGEATVTAGKLRLVFEVLEEPEPIGFRGRTWVRFLQAEVAR